MAPFYPAIVLLTANIAVAFQLPAPEIDDGRQFLQSAPDQSTPLQRAGYAIATNQPSAEQQLKTILKSSPRSPEADQAHRLLSRHYLRTARYRSLASNFDQWRKNFPNSPAMLAQQKDVEQFRGLPDQTNSTPRPVQLRHDGDLWFPVSINGKPGKYLFDTGASVSVLFQSEARRLGLKLRQGSVRIGDSSGIGFEAHTAVADQLLVGTTRFKNVSFMVMPDPAEGPAPSGIMGLPVILGMGSIRWNKSGTADFATPDNTPADRNVSFFKDKPIVRAVVESRSVFLTLDSGAETTDLNQSFAETFPSLMTNAKHGESAIIGAGGTAKFESRILNSLTLSLNNQPVALSPAVVTLQSNPGMGGECCIGNLGDDILFSHSGFSLDFTRMTLRIF